jgi:hypothetical protein
MLPVQGHGSGEDARRLAEARAACILHPALSFRQSWGYLSTSRKEQETYGRFFGTIFWGGAGAVLVAHSQRVATEIIPKHSETAKTNVILFRADPRFSARAARKKACFAVNHLN